MAYNPASGYYGNPGLFSPIPVGNRRSGQVRAPAPYQVASLDFTPPPRNAPVLGTVISPDELPHIAAQAAHTQREAASRASDVAAQEFAAWNPADADRLAAQEAAREFGAMTQYGIDAPRTAATPSGAYTASELDAITQAAQRDAQAEESKSFMERLGLTQPTRDDVTPAFRGLDPGRYNINQYDPLGVGGYHISQNRGLFDPLSLGLQAASAAPGIPGAFGPLSTAFMGITEAMAEARAVDRAREMYGLPTTKSYQRSYQPTPREGIAAGIGQFFGLGTDPLFDEAELAAPGFAGYLGDVGAETGAR